MTRRRPLTPGSALAKFAPVGLVLLLFAAPATIAGTVSPSAVDFIGTSQVTVSRLNLTHRYGIYFYAEVNVGVSLSGTIVGASGAVRLNASAPGLDVRWISIT